MNMVFNWTLIGSNLLIFRLEIFPYSPSVRTASFLPQVLSPNTRYGVPKETPPPKKRKKRKKRKIDRDRQYPTIPASPTKIPGLVETNDFIVYGNLLSTGPCQPLLRVSQIRTVGAALCVCATVRRKGGSTRPTPSPLQMCAFSYVVLRLIFLYFISFYFISVLLSLVVWCEYGVLVPGSRTPFFVYLILAHAIA